MLSLQSDSWINVAIIFFLNVLFVFAKLMKGAPCGDVHVLMLQRLWLSLKLGQYCDVMRVVECNVSDALHCFLKGMNVTLI